MRRSAVWGAVFGSIFVWNDALGQRQFETSQDGRIVARLSSEPEQSASFRGAGVPYGTVPNWQNQQRRQIGALQIADMNGDGLPDLVAGCFNSSSFPPYESWRTFIHYNTGTQLEVLPSWVSTDQVHTGDLQIADFNEDGHPDVFAVNGGFAHSASVIYFGSASGPNQTPGWQTSGINAWALAAAAFDFDHDGDIDVITTNQSGITNDSYRPLYLFRNNSGVMQSSPAWQSQDQMISNGVAVGDVDGDGWEDIATAKWVNFQCAIYKNNNGTMSSLPVWTNGLTSGGRGTALADFDGDGDLDVAYGLDPSRVYRNNGDGTFSLAWTSTAPSPSVQEIKWHDIDRDGDPDLIDVNFSTGRCHIYLNTGGELSTAPSWTYDSPHVGNAFAFGDINGDGCDDLAIAFSGDISIKVFYADCPNPCPADITGDGAVNVSDLLAVINSWGPCPGCGADINGDGQVNVTDLLAVINSWGPCS